MVSKFLEKQPEVGQGWINGGIYHLHASEFNNWNGTAFSLERDYLPECVREGRLHVQTLQTDFIDIGVPESYKYFCSKGGM
jgi:NDP-sugar pyrophosphorylase family protein